MNLTTLHYWKHALSIALRFPGAEASSSYGTPAFKVKKKLFARLWEDGKTLAVYCSDRERWMKARPTVYFITAHYAHSPMVLIDLEKVPDQELKQLLEDAWELRAPRTLVREWKG